MEPLASASRTTHLAPSDARSAEDGTQIMESVMSMDIVHDGHGTHILLNSG
jgi:hypothetical protein